MGKLLDFKMERNKQQDFSEHIKEVLQESMLTGIPQIAAAENWPKKIFRSFIFILCVAGFTYQTLTFMALYWNYDVALDIQVSYPSYVDIPSYTICTPNGFKSKEFCEDPESESLKREKNIRCSVLKPDSDYPDMCSCNPRLCDENGNLRNLTFLSGDRPYDSIIFMPKKNTKKWMLTPKEILDFCIQMNMNEEEVTHYCMHDYITEIPCLYEASTPEYCFTMNSVVGRPYETVKKIFADAYIYFRVHMNEDLMNHKYTKNKLYLSIHSPYTVLNPFSDGYPLLAGRIYSFKLKKVEKFLLPLPYKTDCKDYEAEWHARGGKGPTNMKECTTECKKNISMATYGCILFDINPVGDEIRCANHTDDGRKFYSEFTQTIACTNANCRPACKEYYYTVSLTEEENTDVDCYMDAYKNKTKKELAIIVIFLDGMETTTYTYSPKYEEIQIFSYIGGYVGMWLGISLIAVFDFVETVLLLMKYPLRRVFFSTTCRKKQDQVQRISENS